MIQQSAKRSLSVMETGIVVIAVICVFYVLSRASTIAIPFLLASVLAVLFSPALMWGVRRRVPAVVMVITIMAGLAAVLFPLGLLARSRIEGMLELLPGYYTKLVDIGKSFLAHYEVPRAFWESVNWPNTLGPYVSGMTGSMIGWIGTMTMTLVFLVFMLFEVPKFDFRIRLAFQGSNGSKISNIAHKIVTQISKYLRTLAVISFATGCFVWAALTMIGVDFAITWGFLAFFLNFIPTIGSIVASIPPILVAIVQFYPDPVYAVLTALSLLLIQFMIGNILTPKIMGDTLDLSPVVILISLLCWGLVWGFAGALLSVPIAVMIRIICENVPQLHFIAMMMCSARDGHISSH